jgi:hypothetical protein
MDQELTQEEIAYKQQREREEALARLSALSQSLAKKRQDAIQARAESGIEEDWLEDEEFYQGIDDANRDLQQGRGKPASPEGGPATAARGSDVSKVRSRVFLNITRPYVDAAAAKVADMLLPTDDQNWGVEPTPVPDLVRAAKDNSQILDMATGQPMMMTQDPNGQQRPLTVADRAKRIMDQAKEAARAAENRIDDWLTETNYNAETRKVIESCARLGVGIAKGPYPVARGKTVVGKANGLVSITEQIVVAPETRCISPWNFYPDPSCGSDIHRGSFTWEKDTLTTRELYDLLQDDSYIPETIMQALEEGPQKKHAADDKRSPGSFNLDEREPYEVWYFYGFIEKEDMEAAGCECPDNYEAIPALVTMVNDLVIKAALNPLESGEFPYDVMCWQTRDDYWAGPGVARQIRPAQRILNGATRNMMDNAGLSSGPQVAIKRGVVEPVDGLWTLTPRKMWTVNEDYEGKVEDAFMAINIPTMQAELMGIIQFAIKMAEDITGLPLMLQGQQGKAPETVGGMTMLNNNASTVMRRIARTYDDCVTEPHIRRYYQWLLLDPTVPENEKGDYKIIARGSSALVERDLQNQTIAQMGAMVVNPAFGIDPKRWVAEFFKAQRLDPRLFQYTEDELKQLAQAQQPQKDPAVAVAEMRANVELQKHQLDLQDAQAERQFKLQMAQIERETAMLKLANERNITLDKIKADLAKVAATDRTKRELFEAERNLRVQTGAGI